MPGPVKGRRDVTLNKTLKSLASWDLHTDFEVRST